MFRVGTGVLGNDSNAFDDSSVFLHIDPEDLTLLAFVVA
jgi:hypothetical protein